MPFYFLFSHDKNAGNGVIGTTKEKAVLASLQRPISDQILIALQLFKFCKKNIPSIKYFYVSSDEITSQSPFFEKKLLSANLFLALVIIIVSFNIQKTHKFSCISTFDDILMLCLFEYSQNMWVALKVYRLAMKE